MAEIRCQMCGKQNPEDAEVCQFCQARLKPVWSSKSSESSFEAESESGSEEAVPEWLSSLRGPEESAPGQSSEEAPEVDSFGGIESRETAGGDDWLSNLGKPDEVPPEAGADATDFGGPRQGTVAQPGGDSRPPVPPPPRNIRRRRP